MPNKPTNLNALEAATPKLIAKLASMSKTLDSEERRVFSEIIESAARHTDAVQAHEEGPKSTVFDKPQSTISTVRMKQQYAKLPDTLGLRIDSAARA